MKGFRETRAGLDKYFLPKNINNRNVYVDFGSTKDIPQDACSLRLYGDLTALNWGRWLKFLKAGVSKYQLFLFKAAG